MRAGTLLYRGDCKSPRRQGHRPRSASVRRMMAFPDLSDHRLHANTDSITLSQAGKVHQCHPGPFQACHPPKATLLNFMQPDPLLPMLYYYPPVPNPRHHAASRVNPPTSLHSPRRLPPTFPVQFHIWSTSTADSDLALKGRLPDSAFSSKGPFAPQTNERSTAHTGSTHHKAHPILEREFLANTFPEQAP